MTLRELYDRIGGDYDRALNVLCIEKLMDKHIRRLPANSIFASLEEAEKTMDPAGLFESAHAIKGVCSNLGLVRIASLASEISEEFRPGRSRSMTDDEVHAKIGEIRSLHERTVEGIRAYEQEMQA